MGKKYHVLQPIYVNSTKSILREGEVYDAANATPDEIAMLQNIKVLGDEVTEPPTRKAAADKAEG